MSWIVLVPASPCFVASERYSSRIWSRVKAKVYASPEDSNVTGRLRLAPNRRAVRRGLPDRVEEGISGQSVCPPDVGLRAVDVDELVLEPERPELAAGTTIPGDRLDPLAEPAAARVLFD